MNQVGSGNDFFQGIGRERIDTGKVLDYHVIVAFQTPFLLFNGNTRPVTYVLAAAGQVVEQGGFAAVRISSKCDFNFHIRCFPSSLFPVILLR